MRSINVHVVGAVVDVFIVVVVVVVANAVVVALLIGWSFYIKLWIINIHLGLLKVILSFYWWWWGDV